MLTTLLEELEDTFGAFGTELQRILLDISSQKDASVDSSKVVSDARLFKMELHAFKLHKMLSNYIWLSKMKDECAVREILAAKMERTIENRKNLPEDVVRDRLIQLYGDVHFKESTAVGRTDPDDYEIVDYEGILHQERYERKVKRREEKGWGKPDWTGEVYISPEELEI